MITNADMTLYRKTDTPDGPTYERFVIRRVNWQESSRRVFTDKGYNTEDVIRVFFPLSALPGNQMICKGDVLIRGIIDDELSGLPGNTINDLLQAFPYPLGGVVDMARAWNLLNAAVRHVELEVRR